MLHHHHQIAAMFELFTISFSYKKIHDGIKSIGLHCDQRDVTPPVSTFCRVVLCISAAYAVVQWLAVRPSVCLPVTFVYCMETAKHILTFFTLWYPHRDNFSV